MKSPGTWSSRAGYSTWMNHHPIGLTIRPTKYSAEFMSASVPKLQDEKLQKNFENALAAAETQNQLVDRTAVGEVLEDLLGPFAIGSCGCHDRMVLA